MDLKILLGRPYSPNRCGYKLPKLRMKLVMLFTTIFLSTPYFFGNFNLYPTSIILNIGNTLAISIHAKKISLLWKSH